MLLHTMHPNKDFATVDARKWRKGCFSGHIDRSDRVDSIVGKTSLRQMSLHRMTVEPQKTIKEILKKIS